MGGFPEPRTTPLRGGPVLRWGVLAPGRIAQSWATAVAQHTDQRIVAVASRDLARARAFAADVGAERAYDSYAALLADPEIDAVYVASTNELHREHALLVIAAGKHVLIEKPMGCSAAEAREIAVAARAAGVFAMEAMWTRFLPQTDVLLQLAEDGVLGDIAIVEAEFCAPFDRRRNARVFAPTIGGGALLDIGVYPISFGRFLLGTPDSFIATGTASDPEGVDARSVIVQEYASGARAIATTALDASTSQLARVIGTAASIEFSEPFFMAGSFDLVTGDERRRYADPNGIRGHAGLCYQATAVAAHIAAGRTEAPERPLAESIAVLELIDEARRRIGAIAPAP
ncbi:MAG TPA: Gfo/Idh/MocA family oxidoreductase [Microbacteriaceae bacterium]|nr:Gfo/Idh/MocA family oxidoreductase [Microbacteriaceae bacterium]